MAYLLHFSGPSAFEQAVTLKPGGEPVVVGRDPEAAVYLPDPERLVSRRHLSVEWSEGGARLRVLSPNGISTDQGDWFSGDQVVLADGQTARLGLFTMRVTAVEPASHLESTRFAGMGSRPVPLGPDTRTGVPVPVRPREPEPPPDDPWAELLAEWSQPRHEGAPPARTPPPKRPANPPAPSPAMTADPRALQALCRGLGVPPPENTAAFDWERFGRTVGAAVECLGEHLAARAQDRRDLRAEDRTMVAGAQANPLRTAMPARELLHYLLFMPEGAGGFVPPGRALQEAAQDARWHHQASQAAARSLADGTLDEFEPGRLRAELLKGKLSIALVDNARLWDLYASDYEKKRQPEGEWAGQLFNRHYMAAYLRELERLRRASLPPARQRTE